MVISQPTLALRQRGDLEIHPQRSGRKQFWVVKDPVSLRYFKLRKEEFAILQWLDGRTTLDEIKDRFNQTFAPQRLTLARLQSFLANLYRCGLLFSDGPGQAEQLLARHRRHRRDALFNTASNVLAIRFRGIDPETFLAWLYPKLRWLFGAPFLLASCLLIVVALVLVLTHLDSFWTRLPDFHAFVNPSNLVWLVIVLVAIKFLHELGHALTCKHFGGECHEMGIMLLVFAPCLYCNVTDSWILRSRWQRIAISAAGIGVELLLASVVTFAWWFSHPGFFNTICLNVMAVCAVGTVLLNGNPLLRYDGYFILSDLVDVPNLWQDSRAAVHRILGHLFLGIDLRNRPINDDHHGLLLVYGITSMAYRVFVLIAILGFLYSILVPARLGLVAHAVAAIVLAGLTVGPAMKTIGLVQNPDSSRRVSWWRAIITSLLLVGGGAFFFLFPLPRHLGAPVMLEPHDAVSVYNPVSGTLIDSVKPSDIVQQGDVLGQLDNPDLRSEIARLQGEESQVQVKLENLESLRVDYTDLGARLPTTRVRLTDIQQRLAHKQRELRTLTMIAPVSGTVLPPPRRPGRDGSALHLDRWTGTPLDEHNRGCALETGTLFCLIGDPDQHQAVVFISESQVRYVQKGQQARLVFEIAPATVLTGAIVGVARNKLQFVPREMAGQQDVANRADGAGIPRPLGTAYQVRVALADHDRTLLAGARGWARITVAPQTLSDRLMRWIRTTFGSIAAAK